MPKKKTRKARFVLDGSLTVAWFFEDETDAYAQAVEASLLDAVAMAPPIWVLEVANALLMGERRKRTTEAKVTQFLAILSALPIQVDAESDTTVWSMSLPLARAHNLSVYDATYLELCLRRGLPLATLDQPLQAAAAKVGVDRYEPKN